MALGAAALLAPAVLTSYVPQDVGSLAADLAAWPATFGTSAGVFSALGEFWMGLGAAYVAAVTLNRYGHGQVSAFRSIAAKPAIDRCLGCFGFFAFAIMALSHRSAAEAACSNSPGGYVGC